MSAYVIASVEVLDEKEYERYRQEVPSTLAEYGGRFLVRGGTVEMLEGDWEPHRVVVLEFDTVERARAWYYSPEYQRILPIRQRNSRTGFLVLAPGV